VSETQQAGRQGHIERIAANERVGDGAISLALLRYKGDEWAGMDKDAKCINHIGFWVDDLERQEERIKANGGTFFLDVVKRTAQTTPAGEWIVLMPMGEPPHEYFSRADQLTEGRFPTRHDLDAVAPDHAVYIRAVWGWWSRRPFPSVARNGTRARQSCGRVLSQGYGTNCAGLEHGCYCGS